MQALAAGVLGVCGRGVCFLTTECQCVVAPVFGACHHHNRPVSGQEKVLLTVCLGTGHCGIALATAFFSWSFDLTRYGLDYFEMVLADTVPFQVCHKLLLFSSFLREGLTM